MAKFEIKARFCCFPRKQSAYGGSLFYEPTYLEELSPPAWLGGINETLQVKQFTQHLQKVYNDDFYMLIAKHFENEKVTH